MPEWVHKAYRRYRRKGLSKKQAGRRAFGGYANQKKRGGAPRKKH
jgi:hypothetical protein